jgi:hypothetical protein
VDLALLCYVNNKKWMPIISMRCWNLHSGRHTAHCLKQFIRTVLLIRRSGLYIAFKPFKDFNSIISSEPTVLNFELIGDDCWPA